MGLIGKKGGKVKIGIVTGGKGRGGCIFIRSASEDGLDACVGIACELNDGFHCLGWLVFCSLCN